MKKFAILVLLALPAIYSSAQLVTQAQSMTQSFKQYAAVANNSVTGATGGSLTTLTTNTETQGSAYLLKNWVPGKVTLNNGIVYPESSAVLNFDKMKQALVVKISENQVFEINSSTVKDFELKDSTQLYKFSLIDQKPGDVLIELYTDKVNGLYKTVRTKFFKADFVNKGLYTTGYNYDRYLDDSTYYIKTGKGDLITVENISKKKLKQLEDKIPGITEALQKTTVSTDNKDLFLTELLKNIATK